eukprot:scaffold395_cov383-Prasinococcus_capsulatus_cf.AAC.20
MQPSPVRALCALTLLFGAVSGANQVTHAGSATVTCMLGGGAPDPRWTIPSETQDAALTDMILAQAREVPPAATTLMGFSGFRIELKSSTEASHFSSARKLSGQFSYSVEKDTVQTLYAYIEDEQLIASLTESGESAGVLSDAVVQHIQERTHYCAQPNGAAPSPSGCANAQLLPVAPAGAVPDDDCDIPIVGPDSWKEIVYAPKDDDCGGFVTYQGDNNCYAYANDIVTNTFPQPGRGSGHKWTVNTCEDMKRGSISDGLTWIGTELPTYSAGPDNGHFVALYIWPDTNFHWARMDASGDYKSADMDDALRWSHKPGGTEVRDVDNDGNAIYDPSVANLAPWRYAPVRSVDACHPLPAWDVVPPPDALLIVP